ncbi:hypothetical protein [Devosia nitrariae]|uniref:Uncharacterized protein n=1 Tax=Devosia nitrariae TaxID=2071872 RepID=A0ABQ5WEA4_9HYPH|nr:hypothetical protein [Devosia nitrariae]GLQ57835.1 hypothetical protein GCM10010862_50940 [Devosia nitrariae]
MIFGWRLGGKPRRLANATADYLNIEHNLFDSALLERGIGWKWWERFVEKDVEPMLLAWEVREELIAGLAHLEKKWGQQPQIEHAKLQIDRLLGVAKDPDTISDAVREAREAAILDWVDAFEVPGGYVGAQVLSVFYPHHQNAWAAATFFAESLRKDMAEVVPALHSLTNSGRVDEARDGQDVPIIG